jgi:hypothetical protein
MNRVVHTCQNQGCWAVLGFAASMSGRSAASGRETARLGRMLYWLLLTAMVSWAGRAEAAQNTSQTFSNDPYIDRIDFTSSFGAYNSGVNRPTTGPDNQLAYDYSVHIMKDTSLNKYRMYTGGRWRDAHRQFGSFGPWIKDADGDHILQSQSVTGAPGTWTMPSTQPEYFNAQDYGGPTNLWYSNNSLEPEVFKVGGTYYMYSQVQIDAGRPLDTGGTAATQADRIQLLTSPSGNQGTWTRKTDRGVFTNITNPTTTQLHHQEFVYVPWDADNKPYYMYVAATDNNVFQGYFLVKSAVPDTYDYNAKVAVPTLAQLGNQIGYAKQAPGGPLFTRITFSNDPTNRFVPSLQFSRDGLNWFWGDSGPILLAGSTNNANNMDTFFLGLSTLDGTGELEYLGNNTYRAIYGATTANDPVVTGSPGDIFYSEVGVGELTFTIIPEPSSALLLLPGAWLMTRRFRGRRRE